MITIVMPSEYELFAFENRHHGVQQSSYQMTMNLAIFMHLAMTQQLPNWWFS